jgi:hypothetical protein
MSMGRLGLVGAVLATVLILASVPSAAQRTVSWGAIAFGPKGSAWGSAYGDSSADEANQQALGFCAKRSDDCTVVTTFSNTCGAVALLGATGATFVATNEKRGIAESQAMQACRQQPNSSSCRVPSSICALP